MKAPSRFCPSTSGGRPKFNKDVPKLLALLMKAGKVIDPMQISAQGLRPCGGAKGLLTD